MSVCLTPCSDQQGWHVGLRKLLDSKFAYITIQNTTHIIYTKKTNTDSDTGLDRDSEHIQHTSITHLQAYVIPHQHVVFLSLLHFSFFCHRIQSRIPDPTPAMILAHRHTIFYKLSALSVWKCDWFLFSSLHTSDHGTQSPRRSDAR